MADRLFGTDGLRGTVNNYPMTVDVALRLGLAAGVRFRRGQHQHKVVIGKDTRLSGYMFESALTAGLCAAGMHVIMTGPLPTPAISFLTRSMRADLGVVISASHNPFHDNGIKFFTGNGKKLPDAVEAQIEESVRQPMICVESSQLGRARRIFDAPGRYIEFCKSGFPNDIDLRGLRIALDCAHGAAYHIAPNVFHELGAEVMAVGVAPNGVNINDGVGATRPEHLRAAVLEKRADIGIALDGDGDRLIMVDGNGEIFDGDQLIYVIAAELAKRGRLPGVVGTLMSNLGFEHAVKALGAEFDRAAVGDRYVLERLHERNWRLGGESSGHVLCLDHHTTGDGIVSALQVLAALKTSGQTLAQACSSLTMYPQKLINVRLPLGFDWQGHAGIQTAHDEVVTKLGDRGRVLLRASGTEPLLRVMVEGLDAAEVNQWARYLADAVEAAVA